MLSSAECRAYAEQKLAQAERDDAHRKRLITAAELVSWASNRLIRLATSACRRLSWRPRRFWPFGYGPNSEAVLI
jgi:hypothetical protein